MHTYRRKVIVSLFVLFLVFVGILLLSYVNLKNGRQTLGLFEPVVDNGVIIVLSVIALLRILYELVMIESHHEFERRIR